MAAQAVKVAGRELEHGWPKDAPTFILLKPELESVDDRRVDLKGPVFREIDGQANQGITDIEDETAAIVRYLGVAGMEHAEAGALSYGGQRLLDMGLALATKPRTGSGRTPVGVTSTTRAGDSSPFRSAQTPKP